MEQKDRLFNLPILILHDLSFINRSIKFFSLQTLIYEGCPTEKVNVKIHIYDLNFYNLNL